MRQARSNTVLTVSPAHIGLVRRRREGDGWIGRHGCGLEFALIVNGPLKVKLQLFCAGRLAMGPGKADLLEAIDREGSISAAGRAMGMSYGKCWLLVDTMNRVWSAPLIETRFSGGPGQGASLTDLGREVLAAFRRLEHEVEDSASGQPLSILTRNLAETPRPAKRVPAA